MGRETLGLLPESGICQRSISESGPALGTESGDTTEFLTELIFEQVLFIE